MMNWSSAEVVCGDYNGDISVWNCRTMKCERVLDSERTNRGDAVYNIQKVVLKRNRNRTFADHLLMSSSRTGIAIWSTKSWKLLYFFNASKALMGSMGDGKGNICLEDSGLIFCIPNSPSKKCLIDLNLNKISSESQLRKIYEGVKKMDGFMRNRAQEVTLLRSLGEPLPNSPTFVIQLPTPRGYDGLDYICFSGHGRLQVFCFTKENLKYHKVAVVDSVGEIRKMRISDDRRQLYTMQNYGLFQIFNINFGSQHSDGYQSLKLSQHKQVSCLQLNKGFSNGIIWKAWNYDPEEFVIGVYARGGQELCIMKHNQQTKKSQVFGKTLNGKVVQPNCLEKLSRDVFFVAMYLPTSLIQIWDLSTTKPRIIKELIYDHEQFEFGKKGGGYVSVVVLPALTSEREDFQKKLFQKKLSNIMSDCVVLVS